jgi:hypothetical protein
MHLTTNTRSFTYTRETDSFVTEASTLGGVPTSLNLVSNRTGDSVRFELALTHRDGENDITHWTFRPTLAELLRNPRVYTMTVVIFNT